MRHVTAATMHASLIFSRLGEIPTVRDGSKRDWMNCRTRRWRTRQDHQRNATRPGTSSKSQKMLGLPKVILNSIQFSAEPSPHARISIVLHGKRLQKV